MEIRNCPECGDETVNLGLANWPGVDEPVPVIACQDEACGWAGVEVEYWAAWSPAVASAA